MARDIVLGYDGSDGAKSALATAIDVARAFGDRLVIVYGYQAPGRIAGEEFRAHSQALRELGERETESARELAAAAGIEVDIQLVDESPLDAILDLAAVRDARLIVVGTYGEGRLRSVVLGALPHKLLPLSDRPVLVVPTARDDL